MCQNTLLADVQVSNNFTLANKPSENSVVTYPHRHLAMFTNNYNEFRVSRVAQW